MMDNRWRLREAWQVAFLVYLRAYSLYRWRVALQMVDSLILCEVN